jgi:photosynthetic reaction center H subunit
MAAGQVLARFDVAQITIYVFWLFFAGLIWYLRREDHREGFPLVADLPGQLPQPELPPMPSPKAFLLADGHVKYAPRPEAPEVFAAEQVLAWPGAPFHPTGNPMVDAVGPASYAMRHDEPELAYDDGLPKIIPLRSASDFFLSHEDPDPRGFDVKGDDGRVAGTVVDVWIDRSEYIVRYLEVETTAALGARRVLVPMHFATVRARQRLIKVYALHAIHFSEAPLLRHPDTVTPREEDRICGYFAGGLLYATPERSEPLL